jgi:hypothetical protein
MNFENEKVYKFSDDDVVLWVEQDSSVHIKAVDSFSDPAEITESEARELGELLIKMADYLNEKGAG